MTPEELTRSLRQGAGRAERFRRPMEQAYAKQLRGARQDSIDNLFAYSLSLTAAADWTKPDIDEIYNLAKTQGDMQGSVKNIRIEALRAQMGATLASLGISFDLKNPLIGHTLERMGQQIVQITESQRSEIMGVIDSSWQEGLSIQETARAVAARSSVAGMSRAMRIARTEIAGIQNGGSLAAAKLSGVAATKTWLTAPGAPHPRHEEYEGLDGQTVPLGDLFDVGGYMLDHPGDPDGPPEEIINCRCTIIYGE